MNREQKDTVGRMADEMRKELTGNILPFWMGTADPDRGGFYGRISGHGELHRDAPRASVLNMRLLWTFAAAYRVTGDAACLEMARRAWEYVERCFVDPRYGGVYWSVDAAGNPLDAKKQIYSQGFAIYGMSEYCRATGDESALECAKNLFEAVEQYGKSKGMDEMIGPLGFTDLDPEGMLTWGFDQLGTMPTIYNYPYYPEHMERLGGFEKDNDYVEFKMMVPDTVPEKYTKIAEMIQQRYNLHVRKLTKKDVFEGGYGKKMFDLINTCFKDLYGYSELSDKQIEQYIDMYFPMADLSLITVVEDWNEDRKPVAVGITIPSLARALQKCRRGRLFPFGWWHVLRALKAHKTEGVDLLLLGVLPEYRMKGANALMFADLIPRYQAYGFKWGESQVEMETNENVQSQWQYLDPKLHKDLSDGLPSDK